jgi:thioredoxin 1
MSKLIPIDDASFDARVLSADTPLAVLFSAVWCGPCRHFTPTVERVAKEMGDAIGVVKVDVDASPQLAARYGVRSVPTLVVLKHGEVAAKQVGSISEPALRKLLTAT